MPRDGSDVHLEQEGRRKDGADEGIVPSEEGVVDGLVELFTALALAQSLPPIISLSYTHSHCICVQAQVTGRMDLKKGFAGVRRWMRGRVRMGVMG